MQANSSSLGISRRAPSISVTWEPSVWKACESSTPTTPPPSTTRRSGIALAIVASRLVHAQSYLVQAGDRRHRRQRAGGEEDGALGLDLLTVDGDPALAGEPAVAADQLDPAVLEPRQLGAVVEVVDDLVAARERGGDIELAGHGLRRARDPLAPPRAPRTGAAAPSTACTPRTSIPRRRGGPRRSRPSAHARRAAPPPLRPPARRRRPPHRSSAWTGTLAPTTMGRVTKPRGRQASTWSVRGVGCESRYRRPRKTPAPTNANDSHCRGYQPRLQARCLAETRYMSLRTRSLRRIT